MPMNGPSMVPMPPITTMKITTTVQSLMLKPASGDSRSFCRKISPPTRPVQAAVDDVDDELGAEGVDAEARRGRLGIADRGQRQAVARAQQQIDDGEHQHRDRERHQIEDRVAAGAVRRDLPHDRRRQRKPGAGAEHARSGSRTARTPRTPPRCRRRNTRRAAGTPRTKPGSTSARRTARRAAAPGRRSRSARRSYRRRRRRRGRRRPAGRPRRGRHSPRADSRAAPARGNRPSRRRAAWCRRRPTTAALAERRERRHRDDGEDAARPRGALDPDRLHRPSVPRAREQPARPDDQDDEEREMPGEDLPGRRQRRADRLARGPAPCRRSACPTCCRGRR